MKDARYIIYLIALNIAVIAAVAWAVATLGRLYSYSDNLLLTAVCVTLLIMCVPVFFIFNYRLVRKINEKPAPEIVIVREAKHDERYYKAQLHKFITVVPMFAAQIEAAAGQLDSVTKKRRILTEILERNGSDCPDLIDTCDETADIIRRNIRTIVNRLNIASGIDPKNPRAKELLAKHAETVDAALKKNYGILASFDDFLTYAAGLKDKIIEEDIGLKAAISALKQLY